MAAKNLYNLYEGEELVLEEVALAEIHDFTGLKEIKAKRYIERGGLIGGIYRIEIAGIYQGKSDHEKAERRLEDARKKIFTPEMYQEWKTVCALFKNVIWVENGGRKLTIKSIAE